MKIALLIASLSFVTGLGCAAQEQGSLENSSVVFHWQSAGQLVNSTLKAKGGSALLNLSGECFQIVLADDTRLKSTDFKIVSSPAIQSLSPVPTSPTASLQSSGSELVMELLNDQYHLAATWKVSLREGASYVRESLAIKAVGADVLVKEIVLLDAKIPGAKVQGQVNGSLVVAEPFFLGFEHPMASNIVTADSHVHCGLSRNALLKSGESLSESLVLGIAQSGQMRRSVLAYVERERCHPYRMFLHYNSWFDIAWDKQKFNETQGLEVIDRVGQELVSKRGVQLDSYLFDDGWDDNKTLWRFHTGFPNGFSGLRTAALKYSSGIGVWISPFGGYDQARIQRLSYGSKLGYETNASGFSLAGPKYYGLFRDICTDMIKNYGVNQFKFDGLAAGANASKSGLSRDGDAMLKLVGELRAVDPNIYINQTTGTWPSPFWLLSVDSTYRGGDDHNFQGAGTPCQQWMTYRDQQIYENVVKVAPLYPLNALMLHGIIYATNAAKLTTMTDADFGDQVREFFGSGTQLQELYITPSLLNKKNWDDLAEAANWSRCNADVLVDTHWVGGVPAKGEVYGWASWTPRKGILVLRNPTSKPAALVGTLKSFLDLPPGIAETFQIKSPWKSSIEVPSVMIPSAEVHTFNLAPFETMVVEASPVNGAGHIVNGVQGDGTTIKTSSLE